MSSKNTASLPIKNNRILIVGGASLVGSATAELLLDQGASEVVVLDNFFQGTPEALKHLATDPRLKIIRGDVMRLPQLIDATRNIDGVLHLAAVMTITMHEDSYTGLDVNIRGLQNSLEACRINGVKKFIFASSNAAYGYGPGIVGDLLETTPFYSAGAPPAAILYGASKIIGEQLCRQTFQNHGLNYMVLRYSTVYGERQHYRAANALYIIETHDAILRGEQPKVIGDGSETKHFVHVSDVARANVMAFESDATDDAVNISGPTPITTLQLVDLVRDAANSDLPPEHVEPDPKKVRLTSGGPWKIAHAKARETIGWSPEVDMRDGIQRLLDWRQSTQT